VTSSKKNTAGTTHAATVPKRRSAIAAAAWKRRNAVAETAWTTTRTSTPCTAATATTTTTNTTTAGHVMPTATADVRTFLVAGTNLRDGTGRAHLAGEGAAPATTADAAGSVP
jgi:hypothetical protein